MFKIIAFFIVTLFAQLYMSVVILLTCRKHLHDCIISLRGEVWAHKTRLTLHFIVKRLNQARKVTSHVFVCLGVSMLPLSTISIVDFGIVPTVWYFGTVPTVGYFGIVPTVWYFGTVPTVWYFGTVPTVGYFGAVPTVRYFGTVPTVWYFGTVPTV